MMSRGRYSGGGMLVERGGGLWKDEARLFYPWISLIVLAMAACMDGSPRGGRTFRVQQALCVSLPEVHTTRCGGGILVPATIDSDWNGSTSRGSEGAGHGSRVGSQRGHVRIKAGPRWLLQLVAAIEVILVCLASDSGGHFEFDHIREVDPYQWYLLL